MFSFSYLDFISSPLTFLHCSFTWNYLLGLSGFICSKTTLQKTFFRKKNPKQVIRILSFFSDTEKLSIKNKCFWVRQNWFAKIFFRLVKNISEIKAHFIFCFLINKLSNLKQNLLCKWFFLIRKKHYKNDGQFEFIIWDLKILNSKQKMFLFVILRLKNVEF